MDYWSQLLLLGILVALVYIGSEIAKMRYSLREWKSYWMKAHKDNFEKAAIEDSKVFWSAVREKIQENRDSHDKQLG